MGYLEAGGIDEADICVVNTCTVTSTSDSKSLRLIRNAVKRGDRCVIATGCMVEDDMDLSKLKGLRFIVKNKDKYRIPWIITRRTKNRARKGTYGISAFKGHTRVFVKIQDGCNNVCSYCKVRVVRGCSRSRPFKEVLDECESLVTSGTMEIVLTGICLGAYGRDLSKEENLSRLIKELCKIDGNWRLRLSSIEPGDIKEGLINQLKTQDRLCKHLHIPFQSGDNDILKRMQRPYKKSDYLKVVRRLRDAIPDIAISTDIMVGFPGETERRFRNTLDFIKVVRPMRMHIFPFSKRKGTKADNYKDNISIAVKKKRKDRLSYLGDAFSREFANRFVDTQVKVLVEGRKSDRGYLQGYTGSYIKVSIDGPDSLKGQLVDYRLPLISGSP